MGVESVAQPERMAHEKCQRGSTNVEGMSRAETGREDVIGDSGGAHRGRLQVLMSYSYRHRYYRARDRNKFALLIRYPTAGEEIQGSGCEQPAQALAPQYQRLD